MIKRYVKKVFYTIIRPFQKTSYINNYIYKGQLLKGRTALITGGTSGIGLAIAKGFIDNGCNVIITGRNQNKINDALKELENNNENELDIKGFQFDISDTENIDSTFLEITKQLNNKKIDILVNNAGIMAGRNIENTAIEDYELCLKTNLEGTYFLSQSFFKYLKTNKIKGNILNICSSSSVRPAVNAYSVTKWGLKGLTIGMAKKFLEYGVVVNGIAPGPTYTQMLVKNKTKDKNINLPNNPSGRYVTPEEIANGAIFLVSDMGKMVVGDIMYMTGGSGIITVDDINY